MHIRRRWLVLSAVLALAGVGCGAADETDPITAGGGNGGGGVGGHIPGPELDLWSPPGTEDGVAFAWGVQTGDAGPWDALVSVRTLEPSLSLTVMKGMLDGWTEAAVLHDLTPLDGVLQLPLDNLTPDTTYSLAFFAADGQRRSRAARLRTAVPAGFSRIIRFGATSGLGGNDPWPNLSHAAAERLDFFMPVGDTIYADWGAPVGFVEKWKGALSTLGLNDLTASTSMAATWDDHEVEDNWSYNTPGMEAKAQEAMAAYRQAIPQRLGPGGTGVWRKLSWGDGMDLFILDCRGERRDGNYISPEQMAWLKEGLASSTARFKVINNSVPIIDFTEFVGDLWAEDRWQGYPQQRSEILQHIADQGIAGVLWVSGDFHIGGVGLIDEAGGPASDQWEVLTGPSGSPINPGAGMMNPNERFPVIVKTWSYTLFTADPESGTVTVQFIGDDSAVIDEITLQL
ncbi:MAG: alkaline phosphatase D family protein [Deltaproteobacteria bacterium]|nr:alkaline phosphatase D family protein [Deltaproteobacteria bacterium]